MMLTDAQFFVPYLTQLELVLIVMGILSAFFMRRAAHHSLPLIIIAIGAFMGLLAGIGYMIVGDAKEISIVSMKGLAWTTLHLEILSGIFFTLINAVVFASTWFGIRYTTHLSQKNSLSGMHAATGIFILGMLGVVLSLTPVTFLFFWELMSIASFLLVISERTPESIHAGLTYLIMTQLGAIAITIGFAIVSEGNMFSPFAGMHLSQGVNVYIPFLLFLIGFGSKAGLVPLHAWLPLAHPQAPSHISALMSGAMLKVALYGFLLVLTKILLPLPPLCGVIVIVIGLISALYGVVNAIVEKDIKTMLAWSSIENIGLLFTMVGTAMYAMNHGPAWLVSASFVIALFMAINHALFKSGLFMSAGVIAHKLHTRNIDNMGGIANRMGAFSKIVLLLALAAAALPPAGAFFGEWAFLRALFFSLGESPILDKILYIIIFSVVTLVGGLGVFAMTKYFGITFLGQPRSDEAKNATAPDFKGEVLPIAFVMVGTVIMGIGAPWIFASILGDNVKLFGEPEGLSSYLTHGFAPVTILFVVISVVAYLIHRFIVAPQETRMVSTWDCGQPITSRMEYTGTGFAAPIHFFFLAILQTKKIVVRTPIIETNHYLKSTSVELIRNSVFDQIFYTPISRIMSFLSFLARKLHGGAIGTYMVVMLLTITVALIFGLWMK